MALDLSSLEKALPSSSSSDHKEGVGGSSADHPPLVIKVMCWNIHGSAGRGSSQHRNRLVPLVARQVNPDVLLLQETKTDTLVSNIKRKASEIGRSYEEVSAANTSESRVLYDSKIYEGIDPRRDRVFPGEGGTGRRSLMEALDESIEAVFPRGGEGGGRELRGRSAGGMRELYGRRVAIVGLKRRGHHSSSEERVTVFMSFHNVHTSQGREVRDRAAEGFCEIVSTLRETTGTVVVAGADLNCEIHANPLILHYDLTQRRRRKIDYFLLASPPDTEERSSVVALDFCGAQEDPLSPLHRLVTDLLRPPTVGSIDDYDRSLNHDPLVCDLSISAMPR